MRTQTESFISTMLEAEGVSNPTVKFFIEMLNYFKTSDPIVSTSKKLASLYGCSERTIQRHIKILSKDYNFIHVKPTWNNDNPDRSYIEYNSYYKTDSTIKLESRAEGFAKRDKNVNLQPGLF